MKVFRPAAAAFLAGALLLAPGAAYAQTAAEHIALGDRDFAARNAESALRHYEAAVGGDSSNYEALWKASRSAIDLGESQPDRDRQTPFYVRGEALAKRAVAVNPNDAEGHFSMARALGKTALSLGTRDRIRYATSVREHALAALRLDSLHPGALHVMGVWNAEIMRLNGFSRMMARNFLGGRVFGTANWNDAVRYLERAVAVDPNRSVHHLDLAEIYADRDMRDRAIASYRRVLALPAVDYNDARYKREAEAGLRRLQ